MTKKEFNETIKSYFESPLQLWRKEDVITGNRFKAIAEKLAPHVLYLKSDTLVHNRQIIWRGKHHMFSPADIWITGHSDYTITPDLYNRYKHLFKYWFAVNNETDKENVISIPLGKVDNCDDHASFAITGNLEIMEKVAGEPKHISNLVYMNINMYTYPIERQYIFDLFKDKSWVTVNIPEYTFEGIEKYLQNTRNHKFAICPRGNGVDTHRLWEALYVGSIPIVRRDTAMHTFADLPICWVDNWKDVTPEFLEEEYNRIMTSSWNLKKLTIGYWESYIREKIEEITNKETS
jgi:hypothetical protein